MERLHINRALGAAALLLGITLPSVSDASPCPPMPRRYTPTMEHQIGDEYDVYSDDDLSKLPERIAALSTAYHNRHPNQGAMSEPLIPLVPEPDFLAFFGDPEVAPPLGHFQRLTKYLHEESPNLHEKCVGKEKYCHWAWGVNPKHNDFDASYFRSPAIAKNLRCRPEGVTLIGYVVPQEETNRRDRDYLVTIADLTRAHLPFLKELKQQTLAHLADTWGYDPETDTAQLYFHWPTGLRTSVLHLHAKINFSMSPTESLRGFTLDEVIEALEDQEDFPQGVTSLIADRWGAVGAVLLEKSDENDVKFWSVLNKNLATPTKRARYFKWISDHVKTAWYDSTAERLSMQVIDNAGREMTSSRLISDTTTASYNGVIKALLPDAVAERIATQTVGNDDPNLYSLVRCLYPAALKLYHVEERDTIYHHKCLRYDRKTDAVGAVLSEPELAPRK